MNHRNLTNSLLLGLPPSRQELLGIALHCAQQEAEEWCREVNAIAGHRSETQNEGDAPWLAGKRLLNLLRVVDDILIQPEGKLTSSPAEWNTASRKLLAESPPAIHLDPRAAIVYIERLAGSRQVVRDELARALNDLEESLQYLFGRLIPSLYTKRTGTSPDCDEQILFEASREVMHILYHLENDILDIKD